MEVEVRDLPAQRTLMIERKNVPVEKIGDAYRECLPRVAERAGEHITGPPFGRYTAWRETECDMEIGLPVDDRIDGEGDIQFGEIPASKTACTMHTGSYEGLSGVHHRMWEWCEQNGYDHSNPWESYLNSPDETPEDQLQTAVNWPISERA